MPKPLRPDGKMQVYTFSQGNRLYAAVQKAGIDTKTGKFSPRRTLYGKVKDNVFTGYPVVGVGKQAAIFDVFGFEIPKDCRPSTPSRKLRKVHKKRL